MTSDLLKAAEDLSKGSVLPSRPLRVALGKAFLAQQAALEKAREVMKEFSTIKVSSDLTFSSMADLINWRLEPVRKFAAESLSDIDSILSPSNPSV